MEENTKRARGFAGMDKALQSQIASKGGKAAHRAGTAHEFNSETARKAGSKGGRASRDRRVGVHAVKTDAAPQASEPNSQ